MIRHLVLSILALTTLAHAQEKEDRKGPFIRFLAERVPTELGEVVMSFEKERSTPFTLPSNHLSEPLVPPARTFQLRAVNPDLPLCPVTLPEQGKNFIAILIPNPKGGYQTIVIPADSPDFKAGDVYFYNHASKTVLGYVGTAKFILQPGKGQTLRPSGARKENFYDVGFGVREKEGDRALSSTRWPVDDKVRSYVFFFENPKTRRLDYRAVDEFINPAQEKPGA